MKTLKNLFLSTLVILFGVFSYAQDAMPEPAIVTLISSKNVKDASELVVDLDGDIYTDKWKKDNIVRIEIEIKANDITREVVKHLVKKGRFRVKTRQLENGSVLIYMPNVKLPAYINGRLLSEDISYKLLIPENLPVRIRTWDVH